MKTTATTVAALMLTAGAVHAQPAALPLGGLSGALPSTGSLGPQPVLGLINYGAAVGTGVAAAQPSQPELIASADSLVALASDPSTLTNADPGALLTADHLQNSANAFTLVGEEVADAAVKLQMEGMQALNEVASGNMNYAEILTGPALALDQEVLIEIPATTLDAFIVAQGGATGPLAPTLEATKVAEVNAIDRGRTVFVNDLATPGPDLPTVPTLPTLPGL